MTFDIDFIMKTIKENDFQSDLSNDKAQDMAVSVEDKLTDRQREFIQKAIDEGFEDEIHFLYSGRGMYGETCPAVYLDPGVQNDFGFKGASRDSMGLGAVIYMR